MIACLIIGVIVIGIILVALTILIYNQMLLVNQLNKRLFLFAKESVDKERATMAEYQAALDQIESNDIPSVLPEEPTGPLEEPFDPHNFNVNNLEE